MSHPSWVCGLKQLQRVSTVRVPESHPSWVCGLKRFPGGRQKKTLKSHPSWVCGLKLAELRKDAEEVEVTPFVGVWIETLIHSAASTIRLRHTLRGCVD